MRTEREAVAKLVIIRKSIGRLEVNGELVPTYNADKCNIRIVILLFCQHKAVAVALSKFQQLWKYVDFEQLRHNLGIGRDCVNLPIYINESLHRPLTILSTNIIVQSSNKGL